MITLRVLGAVDLQGADGHSIQSVLAQPKRLALLTYLLLAQPRGFHRRDKLLALFWPESDEGHARNALSQALHFLRRSLGEGVVGTRGTEEIAMDPEAIRCDALEFERLLEAGQYEKALDHFGGDVLAGLHVSDAPDFEHWLDQERTRLRELAATAALKLAKAADSQADWTAAVNWARRATTLCPEDERAVQHLIGALGRSGDAASALRVYDDFARSLAEQLAAEPAAETQALVAAIRARREPLTHEPSRIPAAEPTHGEIRTPAAASAAHPTRTRPRKWLRPAAATGLAILVLAAGALALQPAGGDSLIRGRVLVLPLENNTGDPALDAFGQVASDWITQGIAEIAMAEVIDPLTALASARSATEQPTRESGERLRASAEATRAGTVVSGSYYRRGDSIKVQVTITDARTSQVLRTVPPVGGPQNNPIAAIEEIRPRVLGALSTLFDEKLASLSATSSTPPAYEAYREYTEGLEFFIRNDYASAMPRFSRAHELDSTFVLPLFWTAFAHGNSGRDTQADSVIQIVARSRDRLSPVDRHGLDYLIAARRWDWDAALAAAHRAAALAPESNWAYLVAYSAERKNRPNDAIRTLKQMDPTRGWLRGWHIYWAVLTQAHHMLGQHRTELKEAQRARRLFPDMPRAREFEVTALAALGRERETLRHIAAAAAEANPHPRYTPGRIMLAAAQELQAHGHAEASRNVLRTSIAWHHSLAPEVRNTEMNRWTLAMSLYFAGRLSEARALCEQLVRDIPTDPRYHGCLGTIAARHGDSAGAMKIYSMLGSRFGATPLTRYEQARIAALTGRTEQANELAQEAVRKRVNYIDAHSHPDFASLRSTRAFQELLRPRE